jgi:hypothetical protein
LGDQNRWSEGRSALPSRFSQALQGMNLSVKNSLNPVESLVLHKFRLYFMTFHIKLDFIKRHTIQIFFI